jgi:hypothetical protein
VIDCTVKFFLEMTVKLKDTYWSSWQKLIWADGYVCKHVRWIIYSKTSGSSGQWQFKKRISLDSGYLFLSSLGRHLFLYRCGSDAGCFSLDVKTFQLETVFVSNSFIPVLHAYSNFPPSLLSTPTVSSGKLYTAPCLFLPFIIITLFDTSLLWLVDSYTIS